MKDLTIVCVYVRGPYPYTPVYVTRLWEMCQRWLTRPFRFVCLTDRPQELRGIERFQVPEAASPADGYWQKVRLFDPTWSLTGRVLYLDLDSIVVAPLDPIVDYPSTFALCEDELRRDMSRGDRDRRGRRIVRLFNSSVMVWDVGVNHDLFTRWTPAVAEALSTDQDWIGQQCPEAAAMPADWFPRISQVQPPWPRAARVVLCKKPKNVQAVRRWPELAEWWGAA